VFYHLYEMNHAAMAPLRAGADMMRQACSNPLNPLSSTAFGRSLDAGFEVFERLTRRYIKPEFGLATTTVDDRTVAVTRCGPQTRSEGAAGGAYVRPLRHIAAGNG
jgi:poly(3-hydroxybutyrate) depolymerase